MRFLYTILFYLALPVIFLRLLLRARRLPAYRHRLLERLGYYSFALDRCIWVHAVSVGETIAAIPLIKALKARYPHMTMLVTTTTPTGAERVKAAFGVSVKHVYLPYDLPRAMRRFLTTMHPIMGVIIETELWPNLLAICAQEKTPICLVNARLSEKSARGYQWIAPLTRQMLQHLAFIAANGQQDASRFIALGAPPERVHVTGNLKFDLELPADLIEKSEALRGALGQNRFVWIAASTHEKEEEVILAAHQQIRNINPDALLILVPRHPDRFAEVATMCAHKMLTVRRTEGSCRMDTAIYLGDTMGELLLFYATSDVAFIGGSLITRGGHNFLEPAALAKPMLSGPHIFNFAEISELFLTAKALTIVNDATSLAKAIIQLMQDACLREQVGRRAKCVVDENHGALKKQLDIIFRFLD